MRPFLDNLDICVEGEGVPFHDVHEFRVLPPQEFLSGLAQNIYLFHWFCVRKNSSDITFQVEILIFHGKNYFKKKKKKIKIVG